MAARKAGSQFKSLGKMSVFSIHNLSELAKTYKITIIVLPLVWFVQMHKEL